MYTIDQIFSPTGVSPNTLISYQSTGRIVREFLATIAKGLAETTLEDWGNFQKWELSRGASPNTINQHIVIIRGAISKHEKLTGEAIIKPNPIYKREKSVFKYLTPAQVASIRKQTGIARDLFVFQCETGISYDDMSTLGPENFDKTNEGIMLLYHRGKSVKSTGMETRIPISKEVYDLFLSCYGKIPSYHKYYVDLAAMGKKLGFKLTSHMARHTFGTLMAERGIPREFIATMMGHSNLATTARYSKITNEALFNIMSKQRP